MDNLDETQFLEQCHAYFDGMLTPDEQQELLTLMESNPGYQRTFRQLSNVEQLLKDHSDCELPPGLEDKVLLAVSHERQLESPSPRILLFPKHWHFPLQSVAAILLLAVVGLTYTLHHSRHETIQNLSTTNSLPVNDAALEQQLEEAWFATDDYMQQSQAIVEDSMLWSAGMNENEVY